MADDNLKMTRRGFVKGTGVLTGAAALLSTSAGAAQGQAKKLGPGAVEIELDVNGDRRRLTVEPRATLASVLRDQLDLTGTKIGCDRGACGACTVMLGDQPVPSCTVFAFDAVGRRVTTIEGLARGDQLAPIQAAFVAHDALQCGFCTPGMVMSCHALLQRNAHPSEEDVRQAVSGNLCRCGTYPKVFEAALAAASGKFTASALPAGSGGSGAGTGRPPEPEPRPANESPAKGTTTADTTSTATSNGAGGEDRALAIGVLGGAVRSVDRKVPASEPRPWDASARLSVVGQPAPRLDGPEKVTGRARYCYDIQLPGMLYAAVVRSPHPHARIRAVDVAAAEKMPGVKATYAVERVLGPAELRLKAKAPGKYPLVRYEGQPVAAVAATTRAQAEDAVRRITVDYEVLPHVSDIEAAQRPGSPLVFDGPVEQPSTAGGGGAAKGLPQKGNVRGPNVQTLPKDGDVDNALAASTVRVDERFSTEVQTHSAMETHGAVADWKPDGLTVYESTQGIYTVLEELATLFELPKSKVRVVCEFTGGGFGAKFGAGNHGVIAAHLSRKAKAPVRLFLDRRAEHLAVGNRPSSLQRLRIGAGKDGKLAALRLDAFGSAGCAAGAGCSGPVKNIYPAKVVHIEESDVFLHAGPAAAFRAPGHPQGAFGLEQAMDALAHELGIDPLELRDRNDPHPARRQERRIGAEKIGWAEARKVKPGAQRGPLKRGVGFAQGVWYNFDGSPSAAEVLIHDDGSVECRSGVADIGGGIRTAMAQVVAEVLGIRPSEVLVRIGDTGFPQGPASGGSMTTQMLTPAVRVAAERARDEVLRLAPGEQELRAAARKLKRTIRASGERARDYEGWKDDRYATTIGGAQFAEVEVDTETGLVRVLRVVAVHDCGRPVNRLALESQINGGIIQGISFALFERRALDQPTGRMMNADLERYRIAGSKDVPKIESFLIENYLGRTNTDVSGIGEPATVPTAAAIANAVFHATGKRVRHTPMTPAAVLLALGGAA
jgi:xanthine dehydrogenase YagR molybdenum-binding subunit